MEEVNYFVREFEETRGDLDLQATRNLLKQMEAAGALLQEATDVCAANLDGACEAVRKTTSDINARCVLQVVEA